jgi:hypothetical protein
MALTVTVYTTGETAAILKVTESWLQDKACKEEIPCTMLGGAYHFTNEHIADIIRIFERRPKLSQQHQSGTRLAPVPSPEPAVPILRARTPRRMANAS